MQITVFVQTNKVGSRVEEEIEIPDDELEGLEGDDRENFITDYAKDTVFDGMMFEWGWEKA